MYISYHVAHIPHTYITHLTAYTVYTSAHLALCTIHKYACHDTEDMPPCIPHVMLGNTQHGLTCMHTHTSNCYFDSVSSLLFCSHCCFVFSTLGSLQDPQEH